MMGLFSFAMASGCLKEVTFQSKQVYINSAMGLREQTWFGPARAL
jgi:hypothetical protein